MENHFLITAIIALSLTACSNANDSASGARESDKEVSNQRKNEAAPAVAQALTKEFMTGKWALESDGDCALAQEFKADGSVDGLYESWKLEGANLIATAGGEAMTIALKIVDPKRVEAVVNGRTQLLVRC